MLGPALLSAVALLTAAQPAPPGLNLRAEAERANVMLGTAVDAFELTDRRYARLIRTQGNIITFENDGKWANIHPRPRTYDFRGADRITRFARRYGMKVRGHALVWYRSMPDDLHDATLTREQALRVMKDHIETVVRHFRRRFPGTVIHWDVVNEAFDEDGTRADSKWQTWIGDDYIDWAFRFARRAGGPKLKLYLNEYFGSAGGATTCEAIPKCRAIRDQMLGMQQRGVPIDGLGIQAHLSEPDLPPLRALVDWIGDAGLQWAITELDAPARKEDGILGRRNQADQFRRATRTCVNDPACDTIVTWGMSDRYSWWGDRGVPDALHFDRKYRPKPAALALRDALRDAPRRRRRG